MRTRMSGGVGAGRSILPATRLNEAAARREDPDGRPEAFIRFDSFGFYVRLTFEEDAGDPVPHSGPPGHPTATSIHRLYG